MVCSSVPTFPEPEVNPPSKGRRRRQVIPGGFALDPKIPGGLALDPSPREVRRRRRKLEEGPPPTHSRLMAPARRRYQDTIFLGI